MTSTVPLSEALALKLLPTHPVAPVLTLDVGNSVLKLAVTHPKAEGQALWTDILRLPHHQLETPAEAVNTIQAWCHLHADDLDAPHVGRWIAVAPSQAKRWLSVLQVALPQAAFQALIPDISPAGLFSGVLPNGQPFAIDLSAYSPPTALGIDRVVNVIAAAGETLPPACNAWVIADFGTATTVDVLVRQDSAQWQFWGGVIQPGLETLWGILGQKTEQLPTLTPYSPAESSLENTVNTGLGGNTHQAMHQGLAHMVTGGLANIHTHLLQQGLQPAWVFTGGGAQVAQQLLAATNVPTQTHSIFTFEPPRLDPLWTHRGIALLAKGLAST